MSGTATALAGFARVDLTDLHPSPNNPRERLTDIDGLALSMRESGLIQPIIAQRIPGRTGLQIIAGHRRHAAALRLGWTDVPVIIRRDMLPDAELLAMLVENGQRAGLDPIEEARAYRRLIDSGLGQAEIAAKVGRSTFTVSTRLSLLALPIEEQEALRANVTTIGSALDQARLASGRTRAKTKAVDRAWHFAHTNPLAAQAKARCTRIGHKLGRRVTGGIACGECWESVIRANEREHLNTVSNQRGRCVLCDVAHDPDRGDAA